jgi:hypothetical protein
VVIKHLVEEFVEEEKARILKELQYEQLKGIAGQKGN